MPLISFVWAPVRALTFAETISSQTVWSSFSHAFHSSTVGLEPVDDGRWIRKVLALFFPPGHHERSWPIDPQRYTSIPRAKLLKLPSSHNTDPAANKRAHLPTYTSHPQGYTPERRHFFILRLATFCVPATRAKQSLVVSNVRKSSSVASKGRFPMNKGNFFPWLVSLHAVQNGANTASIVISCPYMKSKMRNRG